MTKYCKFCGEVVEYVEDFRDHYCKFCQSYQTTSHALKSDRGKKSNPIHMDQSPPSDSPPRLPPAWRNNIPVFRHRQYLIIQSILSFGPHYSVYNVSGKKMFEVKGKILSMGGEFDFYDNRGNHIAKIHGNISLFGLTAKEYTITDQRGNYRGLIKSTHGFFKRMWELYDERGVLIGRPNEQVWFKRNWQMTDGHGKVLLEVDKKLLTWQDQFTVVVSEQIDPLIALAYAVAIDYLYFQNKS
ncbi:MAG: LURP-one-related/scramblase family protein [Candidatus Heimdallarchaeota archaeon]